MIVTYLFCLAVMFALISANELWHRWCAWRSSKRPAKRGHSIAESDLHDRAKVLR